MKKLVVIIGGFLFLFIVVFCVGYKCGELICKAEKENKKGERGYQQALNEWNEDVRNGVFRSIINDKVLVSKVLEDGVRYIDSLVRPDNFIIDYCLGYQNCNYAHEKGFKKVELIDTVGKRLKEVWIKSNLIKPVHSNWGLTQDVWLLDKKIAEMQKSKKGVLSDNPFINK